MKTVSSQLQEHLQIVVKCVGKFDGRDLPLTIGSNSSVLDLKKLIKSELAANGAGPVPVEKQRLIFFGRLLNDNKQRLCGEGGINMKTDGSTNFVHLSPLPDGVATNPPSRSGISRKPRPSSSARAGTRNREAATPPPRAARMVIPGRRNRRMEPYPTANRESTRRPRTSLAGRLSSHTEEEDDDPPNASSTDDAGRIGAGPGMDSLTRWRGGVRDDREEPVVPQDAPSAPDLVTVATDHHAEAIVGAAPDHVSAVAAALGQHLAGAGLGTYATASGVSPLTASVLLSAHLPSVFPATTAPHSSLYETQLFVATLATRLLPDVTLLSDRLRDIVWSVVTNGSSERAFDQQVSVAIDLLDTLRNSMSGGGVSDVAVSAASETLSSIATAAAAAAAAARPSHVGLFSPATTIATSTLSGTDLSTAIWDLVHPPPPPVVATLATPILGHPTFLGLGSPTMAVSPAFFNPFLAGLTSDHLTASTAAALYGVGGGNGGAQFISTYPPPPPTGL
jgi:Ubiquitin family